VIRKLLLVNGCARGGTRYMNALIQAVGVKTKHEAMGKDGSVTSFFAMDLPKYKNSYDGHVRSDYEFEHIWQLIRHPLSWVRSAHVHLAYGYWKDKAVVIGEPFPHDSKRRKLSNAHPQVARFWVRWNELMEQQRPDLVIRLEECASFWPQMMGLLGKRDPFPKHVEPIGHNSNVLDPTPEVTWEMLGEAEQEVRGMAARYGYEV
jgi:hypothetical protein